MTESVIPDRGIDHAAALRMALALEDGRPVGVLGQISPETAAAAQHYREILQRPLTANVIITVVGDDNERSIATVRVHYGRDESGDGNHHPIEAEVLGGVLDRVQSSVVDGLKAVGAL